jgi:glutamate N-acetyltransferase/amino-acid N-acetyltransferase
MEQLQLPRGFQLAAFSGGLKASGNDMALLFSTRPAECAGVFTRNRVRAACVDWNREIIGKPVRAILVNSGNANACTGSRGMEDSRALAEAAAKTLNVKREEVLLASTGVIGVPLPIDSMCAAVRELPKLHETPTALKEVAEAIMTTDTVRKIASYEFQVHRRTVRIVGIAKGSGMIHPDMATMLGFIMTDVKIEAGLLQPMLSAAVDESFNMISVDGDTSTNDMALIMANGTSGISIDAPDDIAWKEFKKGLFHVTRELAIAIARDGEGATKLIEVEVTGGIHTAAARTIARSVVSSNLVKAAIFGEDANWGRILAAMGYSGAEFETQKVDISFAGPEKDLLLMENGTPLEFSEKEAARLLSEKEVKIRIKLSEGEGSARAWGCDLTYDYVKINGSYRT